MFDPNQKPDTARAENGIFPIEDAKIKCAEAFFKQLTIDGYTVSFHTQLSNKKVKQIIDDVIAG